MLRENIMLTNMIALTAFVVAITACGAPPALAEKRVAIVIGIDRYENLESHKQLRNAVNDARAAARAFEQLGFQVTKLENVGRLEIARVWGRFLGRIDAGDIAAFHFSGHGIESAGSNYLMPSDVPKVGVDEEELLKSETLSLSKVLDDLRLRKPRVSLLIVDACRNNPMTDGRVRNIGSARGLARIEPPRGTFVMYSAGAGQLALDRISESDANPNSVYMRVLLPLLTRQGMGLAQIAREVRSQVHNLALEARHEQTPAYYDELVDDFYPAGRISSQKPPIEPKSKVECGLTEVEVNGICSPGPKKPPREATVECTEHEIEVNGVCKRRQPTSPGVAKPREPKGTTQSNGKQQQRQVEKSSRPGQGGNCASWMFYSGYCYDAAGRRCVQTPGGRVCN